MPPEVFQFKPEILDLLAPFYIAFDGSGTIRAVGPSLRRVAPGLIYGASIGDVVTLQRPAHVVLEGGGIGKAEGKVLILSVQTEKEPLRMRGSVQSLHEEEIWTFVGSPWIEDLQDLSRQGLRLSDYALHDPVTEYMMLLQSKDLTLRESEALADALAVAKKEAEAASEAKSAFLAVMSHEIRNPMNGLGSMADLLAGTTLDENQAESVRIIQECASSLRGLVDDVLDLSKIEAGQIELEEIPFRLKHAISSVLHLYQEVANSKSLLLSSEWAPDVPEWLSGDPTRLRQILSNLVGNAIKFTASGQVLLRVSWAPASDDLGTLCVRVTDSGCGVDENAAKGLFQPFVQADTSTTRRFGGTGLGLAISRDLARAMGGDVGLESTGLGGSTFVFDAVMSAVVQPWGPTAANEGDPEAGVPVVQPAKYPGKRVLVADDNPTNRLIAARLLEHFDIYPVLASNGLEALAAAEAETLDLILMDMQMPEMGGAESALGIRALASGSKSTPIIAFTANVLPEQATDSTAAGMDGVLAKPVRLEELAKLLARYF